MESMRHSFLDRHRPILPFIGRREMLIKDLSLGAKRSTDPDALKMAISGVVPHNGIAV